MHWLLIAIYLNAATGQVVNMVPQGKPYDDPAVCVHDLEATGPINIKNGVITVYRCRMVDKNGVPVPERKLEPRDKPPAEQV